MDLNNLLHPKYYFSSNHTKIEFDKIFSNQWIFVAMEEDLSDNNMFITLSIFNYPIVIQNFKGEIKAFQNICPHRFNLIQTERTGKRPFVCQYHSWSFDCNGKPNTKSLKSLYDVESESFGKVCVKNISLEKVGKFYFINLSKKPSDIKEYLGGFYEKLLEISSSITDRFYFDDDFQKVNWKVIVENVIEAYHCPSIHKDTLFGMGFCSVPENNQVYVSGHSVADYPKNNDFAVNKMLKYLENRTFKHNTFRHYFIFPNLLISSTEGTSIYVGNVLPNNESSTILRKRFYDVKFHDDFVPNKSIHNAFLEMVKTSINSILFEDKVILEQVQKNLEFVNDKYILGNQEQRIVQFHNHYTTLINE